MFRKLLLIFVFITTICFSQKSDVIYQEWKAKIDTVSNIDNAILIDKQHLNKVSRANQIYILNNIAIRFEDKKQRDSAHFYANKSLTYKNEFPKHPAIAEAYIAKATIYMRNQQLKKAKKNMHAARKVLIHGKANPMWASYYQQMGSLLNSLNSYENSIQYSDSAIQFLLRLKDTFKTANLYHNLGIQYYNQNKLENAVSNLLKAISIKEKYDKKDSASSYFILALMYNNNNILDQANKYIKKAIKAAKEQKLDEVILRSYLILAKQFTKRKLSSKALAYNDSCLFLSKKMNMWSITTELIKNKGDIYFDLLNDKKRGGTYYQKAYERLNSKEHEYQYYKKLAVIEKLVSSSLSNDDPSLAKVYLTEFKNILNKNKDLGYQQKFHKESAKYFNAIGKYKTAIFHYKKSYSLYDSINNIDTKEKIAALEKKYDTKNKELKIAKLNEENARKEQLISKAKFKQQLLIVSIISLALLFLSGYYFYNKLRQQKKELAQLNSTKTRLFSIISHDLRGMLIPFQRVGKVINHYIDKKDYEKTNALSQELQRNSERLSNTLDNLLNWSIQQMNGYSYNEEEISIQQELTEIIESYSYHAKLKNTKVSLDIKKDEIITFDKGGFHLIFRNLINNAIKYTENGTIKISVLKKFNVLHFTVTDSGIGIPKEQLKNIFTLTENNASSGTQGEKGSGLGLNLVYKFVQIHNGDIKVSSEQRIGTKFELSFPIKDFKSLPKESDSLSA